MTSNRFPPPEFPAIASEIMAKLSPRDRRIIQLLLAGHTQAEVGQVIGLSARQVRRRVSAIRQGYARA